MIKFLKLRTTKLKKAPLAAALLVMMATVGGTVALGTASVSADDSDVCTPAENDMIHGGFNGPGDLINKINNGAGGHTDLGAIYANFGLDSADYSAFASSAVPGMATKSGEIIVDGKTVATDGISFGRQEVCHGDNGIPMTVGGTTIWGNTFATTFVPDSLAVNVLFDNTGTPIFVAIDSCGNPAKFKPVKPVFSCDLLEKHPVDGKKNTYTFTTKATADRGATIAKVVYDFGDGSEPVTLPDIATPTEPHTFTKSSVVTVTVFVDVPGGKQIPVTSETCQQPITVKEKPVTPTPPEVPTPKPPVVKLPVELPKTGAGGVLPLFSVAVVGGYFASRWLLSRPRRSQAVDKQ